MADQLVPGLWWLHGTRGSNVYAVEADDGQVALVDSGFRGNTDAVLRELAALDLIPRFTTILLTHMHADHAGSAGSLHRATGARVVAGLGDCEEREGRLVVRPHAGRTHPAQLFRARGKDCPVASGIASAEEVLPGIRAVPAPGHTAGSMCYVVPRLASAFVGDLVINHGGELTRSLRAANQDDAQYLETLREFGRVAPARGLPGHGAPMLDGFGDALRALAALPRRRGGPRDHVRRAARLLGFGRGLTRVRTPAGRRDP